MAKIKLTLTNQEVGELKSAIKALDGYEKIVKDGEKERAVLDYYKLGTGFKASLAKNQIALKPAADAYEMARNAVFRECSGGEETIATQTEEGKLQMQRLNARLLDLSRETNEVELLTVKLEELRLDTNDKMPITVIGGLGPILDDFREEKPADTPRDLSPSERAAEAALVSSGESRLAEHLADKPNGKTKCAPAAAAV